MQGSEMVSDALALILKGSRGANRGDHDQAASSSLAFASPMSRSTSSTAARCSLVAGASMYRS